MKKLYIILGALALALISIIGMDGYVKHELRDNLDKAVWYNNIYTRNCSDYIMEEVLTENSVVVLGSSELSASDYVGFPPVLFNYGYSDFDMVLMGAGSLQSLAQTINLGALQNNIKNNKVVLILSPQWFTESHLSSAAFSSRFEEANYVEFIKNDNISKNTRIAVSERVKELLVDDAAQLERVKKYEAMYLYHSANIIERCEMMTYNVFRDAKTRFTLLRELNEIGSPTDYSNYVKAEEINFEELMGRAELVGEESCTNNEYGVYDSYFDTYIRAQYASYKDSSSGSSYLVSPEYGDFRLFLEVCKETGIEPLIISVPVNGRWYDYTGFPKTDRNQYYANVRAICKEYDVKLADFSVKEYELYFLKDIMHMGWKGWVYLDEAVYKFYKGESIEPSYIEVFEEDRVLSERALDLGEGRYLLTTDIEENLFNSVVLQMYNAETKEVLTANDITYGVGEREGLYCHNAETGEYVVKLRANSNKCDEYVQKVLQLEKGQVYRYKYDVVAFGAKEVILADISFAKEE